MSYDSWQAEIQASHLAKYNQMNPPDLIRSVSDVLVNIR